MSPPQPRVDRRFGATQDSKLYMRCFQSSRRMRLTSTSCLVGVANSLYSYTDLLSRRKYFDYTSMIATAVAFLESDQTIPTSPPQNWRLRHIREDVKYVVVDEYQDVNAPREANRRPHSGGRQPLLWSETTIRRSTSGAGSEVSNILTFAIRHDNVRTIALADNFRSSRASSVSGEPSLSGSHRMERLPKAMEYASHQAWKAWRHARLEFTDPNEEAAWIVDRVRSTTRDAVHRHTDAAREDCHGRTARCSIAQSKTASNRWLTSSGAWHPLHHQGTRPAVRCSGDRSTRWNVRFMVGEID